MMTMRGRSASIQRIDVVAARARLIVHGLAAARVAVVRAFRRGDEQVERPVDDLARLDALEAVAVVLGEAVVGGVRLDRHRPVVDGHDLEAHLDAVLPLDVLDGLHEAGGRAAGAAEEVGRGDLVDAIGQGTSAPCPFGGATECPRNRLWSAPPDASQRRAARPHLRSAACR
jgi:hypothetical protein